jgi:hypothetical protein
VADTIQDDLELKPARAGAAFRAEMFVTDFALRYWKHAVAIVAVLLLSVLGYGQYTQYTVREQRRAAAEIAEALSKLEGPLPYIASQLAQGEVVDLVKVEAVGDELAAIANGATGTAAAEARMSAAEAFRLAGNKAKQREALTRASPDAEGVLAWSVESALANLDLEEQKGDDAVAHLEKLSKGAGFLAEIATLDLGLAYESLARPADAARVYADFLTRFPTSTRTDEVKARQARLAP